jgi:thioredoxin reductase
MRDVIILGAGPAGLSAALLLGRCRRRVTVVDSGTPRNACSPAVHGFLSRDGIAPAELRAAGRADLRAYPSVELREDLALAARPLPGGGFEVELRDGPPLTCRKLLVATGVVDDLPEIDGFAGCHGRSVFHCPYCDGWEVRDQPLAVYCRTEEACAFALGLSHWSRDLVLCTDGPAPLDQEQRERLARRWIPVREDKLARLEHEHGELRAIVFATGAALERKAIFFHSIPRLQSSIAVDLGAQTTHRGVVKTGKHERTNVPDLFVAGDASRDVQLAIIAASEGVQAAFEIHTELAHDDLASADAIDRASSR